jgi:hypothetical protein
VKIERVRLRWLVGAGAAGSSAAGNPSYRERGTAGAGAGVRQALFADWVAVDPAGEAAAGDGKVSCWFLSRLYGY